MRNVLILGAGIYQLPLIQAAKRMGLHTMVASIPGDYPGFAVADEVYDLNTTDTAGILALCTEKKVDGICTCGTDVAMRTVGAVCDALGLKGVSEQAAANATNKILMKQCFRNGGVNTADFREVAVDTPLEVLELLCERLQYPVIFKATDLSGSRGIVKVYDKRGIPAAVDKVKAATKRSRYLIEKLLVGEEFGIQAFVQDGNIEFVLPTSTEAFEGDTGVPAGHAAPYRDEAFAALVYEQTKRAIDALGLDNCAVNADGIVCDGVPYLFEMGARCGATCLAELLSIYYGFDHYENILRVALGEQVDFSPKNARRVPNASALLRVDRTGVVRQIVDRNQPNPQLVAVQIDCKEGDRVRKFLTGPDRVGHVIAKGDTLEEAVTALRQAVANITILVEEDA